MASSGINAAATTVPIAHGRFGLELDSDAGGGGGGGSGQSGGGGGGEMVGVDTLQEVGGTTTGAGTMTSVASGDTPSVTRTFQVATVITNSFC